MYNSRYDSRRYKEGPLLSPQVIDFLKTTNKGILTTFRRDGGAQMSIVSCGPFSGGVAFSTTAPRAKLKNLQRDPHCSLLVSQPDWWGYLVLEGHARLLSPGETEADELCLTLRDVYRVAGGGEHPNWEEYDRAMQQENRSAVIVVPERVYGTRA